MLTVTIAGDPMIAGTYTIEPRGAMMFTAEEFHLVKRETGLRAAEIDDAARAGDTDLIVAIALVALHRAGRPLETVRDLVWRLSPDEIQIAAAVDRQEAEGDAVPPGSGGVASGSPAATPPSSGPDSSTSSADSPLSLAATGSPGLPTGLASGREMSATSPMPS